MAAKLNQKGQTTFEYIFLTMVILSVVMLVMRQFADKDYFFKNVTQPMVGYMRYNYKYADPQARGWDEGSPKRHIQIQQPAGETFRLFTASKR